MTSSLYRTVCLLALLARLLVPWTARAAEPLPKPRPGWQERAARMEAELKQMREEAAKNPHRPSVAQLQRELDEMAAERDARISRQSKDSHRQWLLTGSFGLNAVLALALLWALRRRGSSARAAQA